MNRYTAEQLASFPWLVSSATLRTEDLLPAFWTAAEQCAAMLERPLDPELLATLERLVGEDSSEDAWDDAAAFDARLQLEDVLQDLAPAGCYFGSHEGDGACFGFWLPQDWCDALEHCGWAADDSAEALVPLVVELLDAGVDPDNVEDSYCGRAEGYTEEDAGADFAEQLADESGLIPADAPWPLAYIDWGAAWRDLAMGDRYFLVEAGGRDWAVFRAV